MSVRETRGANEIATKSTGLPPNPRQVYIRWVISGPTGPAYQTGCIPVVILYFLFVDKYVQGMSGALKG